MRAPEGALRALPGGMRGENHLCYTATHSGDEVWKGAA